MKTQRRHELQTNQLADSLARWIEAAKPYSRALLAGLVALVVIVFAWGYMSSSSGRREADGWNEYYEAFTPGHDPREALSDIAQRYAGMPVSHWARLTLADIELDEGTNRLFVEKKDGRDQLRQSVESFSAVRKESKQPMIQERATYGLARGYEAMGRLDEARKEYLAVADQWPQGAFAAAAKERAADLEKTPTKEFYDWFARYEPPRPMSREPGTPGLKPDFLKDTLEDNSLKLPSAIDDKLSLPKFGDPAATPAAEADTPPAATDETKSPEPTTSEPKPDAPPAEKPAEPGN